MNYTAHKVNKLIFEGFLNGDQESLTLNTLQNLFNKTIENFSEEWILILDDQYECSDFSVPASHRFYGHKYYVLMDYKTNFCYRIGIPNPKDIASIESRQKFIIIYKGRSISSQEIDTVFQKYLMNNKGTYIVSGLKSILIHTFSLLFQQKKENYYQTMQSRPDTKECKTDFFQVDFEVDDVLVSYNVDEDSIVSDKESIFKELKGLFKIQNANRKEILLKDYSSQEILLLINLSLGIFDLMRAINEYIRGDASVYLKWEHWGRPFRFDRFNSIILKDFKDEATTEDTLKLVRERISEKVKEINEDSSLRRKINSGIGFKSYEFRLKEFLAKLQVTTKVVFSVTISRIGKFVKKRYRNFVGLLKKRWFHIPLAYVILSVLSAFFQASFNGDIKPFGLFIKLFDFFKLTFIKIVVNLLQYIF